MAKVLSQEEIDALLNSVSAGEDSDVESAEGQKKLALYDFKHPNLISKEQMRLLENVHEGLVRNLGVYLSAQLRMIVDMNLLAIDQIMYSEFVMSIASPAATYVGQISDPASQFVLEISPQLVVFIVERLFGGQGSFVSISRPISVIERKIMTRVVDRISNEISKNWKSVKEFECQLHRFESNPEFVQIVPASEPVVVVSMEIKVRGNTTMMNICYPYMWISNVLSRPEVQSKILFGAQQTSQEERDIIESSLGLTRVDFKVMLGKTTMTVSDVINLKVGDVLRLDTRIGSKIPAFVYNMHAFDAYIGCRDRNYAVRIHSILKGAEEDEV
jgi:flagellar motor switch protein FliM